MLDFAEGFCRNLLDLTTEKGHLEGYPFVYPSLMLGVNHLELDGTSNMINDAFAKLFQAGKRELRIKSLFLKGNLSENFEELVRTVCGTLRLHELAIQIKSSPIKLQQAFEFEERSKIMDSIRNSHLLSSSLRKFTLELPGLLLEGRHERCKQINDDGKQ